MELDLIAIERELKARWERPYNWHNRKQNNADDQRTAFIYSIPTWAGLQTHLETLRPAPDFEYLYDYAANRWYNFWSARAVEALFARSPRVTPHHDPRARLVDFTLDGIRFDHKTSVFPTPKTFRGDFAAARRDPEALIRSLYAQQSGQGRFHLANRLFVVLHDAGGDHWKLKAEIGLLARAIDAFLAAPDIRAVELAPGRVVRSAVIFVSSPAPMPGFLDSARRILRQYQQMGAKTLDRLSDDQLNWRPHADANSVAHIVRHLEGNMRSRWTDFLITDGEKPDRDRDAEFADDLFLTAAHARRLWEEGWQCVWTALDPLTEADLSRIIHIRAEPHTVQDAILRQLAHYPYHVGQMIHIAKELTAEGAWESLSIPKNRSQEFNREKFGK